MRLSAEEKGALVARYHAGEAVTEICADTGIARSTLYTWIKPYTTTTTGSGHVVSQQELITLKQKNQKLQQKLEILQKVGCTVSSPFRKNCRNLPNCMANTASTRSVKLCASLAGPSITISPDGKK